jgi:hypothetical protein
VRVPAGWRGSAAVSPICGRWRVDVLLCAYDGELQRD